MAQGPDAPSDYDWEDGSVPDESEPPVLPDHRQTSAVGADPAARLPGPTEPAAQSSLPGAADGSEGPYGAPTFTFDPQEMAEEPLPRRGTLPSWAIVAIVVVQAAALVACVALVLGGVERITARDPEAPVAAPSTEEETPDGASPTSTPEREPGTVTDAEGREVTDGTGAYDQPAAVGEHTLSWTVWTKGTIAVTALEVDLAATAPEADGQDVVQDGYRLVLATYEVRYDGVGQLAPSEELWLTGESDRTYFPDIGEGLVEDPMKRIEPLQDGESARFRSAFLVPEAEIDTFHLGVETFSGEILYFATP